MNVCAAFCISVLSERIQESHLTALCAAFTALRNEIVFSLSVIDVFCFANNLFGLFTSVVYSTELFNMCCFTCSVIL